MWRLPRSFILITSMSSPIAIFEHALVQEGDSQIMYGQLKHQPVERSGSNEEDKPSTLIIIERTGSSE